MRLINSVVLLISCFWLSPDVPHLMGQDAAKPTPLQESVVPNGEDQRFENQYRLLIDVHVSPNRGLIVAGLQANSPTASMILEGTSDVRGSLEPNDIITHVNRQPVPTLERCHDALNQSGGDVLLTVIDKRSGQPANWNVKAVTVRVARFGNRDRPPEVKRIARVLLIGLTNDPNIGESMKMSLESLEKTFRNEIPADRLDLEVVSGNDCNARTIIDKVRRIGSKCRSQDTLLCYYVGHGAYDPQLSRGDPSGGHFFQIPDGDLPRRTLFDNLRTQPGRLKILITDTCNVEARVTEGSKRAVMEEIFLEGPTELEQLLLYHRGILDLSATSRGQFGWSGGPFGSWFTYNFVRLAPDQKDWPNFLSTLKRETNDFFLSNRERLLKQSADLDSNITDLLRKQTAFTPAVFQMSLVKDTEVERRPPTTVRRVRTTVRYVF